MQPVEVDEEVYVDVRSLPLKPPQPLAAPERPVRRCWHPVMWDDSITGVVTPVETHEDEEENNGMSREYPHKQRIRNLRKLIADGKVKPTSETLIFFLCNKFTVSDERQTKMKAE
ncbi:putative type 1 pili usher protein [Operophtera brumata]|uniref:Putative type 1 pili usher protein n=1 Tax=Operophtera brumata TaxID=104452 RepID=A0A0L7LJR5_OPEBR|nr:putative type 1 pili usher protein [Operophtera brumata]